MQIDIITLFPGMFAPVLNESILKRAQEKNLLTINTHGLREFGDGPHKSVDDTPYGGGTGMVLRVDVIDQALQAVSATKSDVEPTRILLTPQGERLNAKIVEELAQEPWLVLICGHYEGFDERVREHLVDRQISIGDYVLTGGELPAMVLTDAISRHVPGVLPADAAKEDSFSLQKNGQPSLEYPHYTKPAQYKDWTVPEVLLSGNHAEIAKWRESKQR